jgi:citrate lyase subunit beta/citryl-CoA lyase
MDVIRSLLFVPGDSERKIAKAVECTADALILDLEDSVVPDRKPAAREICRAALKTGSKGPKLFVRINALDTPEAAADLAAVMQGGPSGIVLPKCQSARDLLRLGDMLTVLEAREGLTREQTWVLPVATETGSAMLGFGSYAETRIPRLFGMMWGGEDLAADLGAKSNRDETGRYAPPYQFARSLCLCAAAATGSAAIDAVFTDIRNERGLEEEAIVAARSGFVAKAAIHPGQVEIINRAFMPTADEVAHARQVVEAFTAAESQGVAVLNGKMLDRPHHRAALRILAAAKELDKTTQRTRMGARS